MKLIKLHSTPKTIYIRLSKEMNFLQIAIYYCKFVVSGMHNEIESEDLEVELKCDSFIPPIVGMTHWHDVRWVWRAFHILLVYVNEQSWANSLAMICLLLILLVCRLLRHGERLGYFDRSAIDDHNFIHWFISRARLCRFYFSYYALDERSRNEYIRRIQWKQLKNTTKILLKICLTIPLITFPKTTCRPSNHSVFFVVRKNCDPLVFLPALAIDSHPGP